MPPALYACGIVLLPALTIGLITHGWAGLAGAGTGVVLTAVGFAASWYFVVWTEPLGLKLVLPAGLMGLVAKIILFSFAFLMAKRYEWSGMMPMAAAAFVSIVAVLIALMLWGLRTKLPPIEPLDD